MRHPIRNQLLPHDLLTTWSSTRSSYRCVNLVRMFSIVAECPWAVRSMITSQSASGSGVNWPCIVGITMQSSMSPAKAQNAWKVSRRAQIKDRGTGSAFRRTACRVKVAYTAICIRIFCSWIWAVEFNNSRSVTVYLFVVRPTSSAIVTKNRPLELLWINLFADRGSYAQVRHIHEWTTWTEVWRVTIKTQVNCCDSIKVHRVHPKLVISYAFYLMAPYTVFAIITIRVIRWLMKD